MLGGCKTYGSITSHEWKCSLPLCHIFIWRELMCIRSLSLSLIPAIYIFLLVVLPVSSCPAWSIHITCCSRALVPVSAMSHTPLPVLFVPVYQASESATLVNAITSECRIGCVDIASFWIPQTVPHQYVILPVPVLWSIDCLQPPTMSLIGLL